MRVCLSCSVILPLCLSFCNSVCLSVCYMFVVLSVSHSVCQSACRPVSLYLSPPPYFSPFLFYFKCISINNLFVSLLRLQNYFSRRSYSRLRGIWHASCPTQRRLTRSAHHRSTVTPTWRGTQTNTQVRGLFLTLYPIKADGYKGTTSKQIEGS